MIPPHTDRDFELRKHRIWKVLAGTYGEVMQALDLRDARIRRLRFEVALPGYALATEATMVFVERWHQAGGEWRRVEYAFDYLLEPRGSGRRAHHFHDDIVHAHCEDPEAIHPHYRDVEVDLLEAAEDFASYYLRGWVRCAGLFPL